MLDAGKDRCEVDVHQVLAGFALRNTISVSLGIKMGDENPATESADQPGAQQTVS